MKTTPGISSRSSACSGGSPLQLTDGLGNFADDTILDDHKKKCTVQILTVTRQPPRERNVSIAISLLKNASRFEWFLEKATEIGVTIDHPFALRTHRKTAFPAGPPAEYPGQRHAPVATGLAALHADADAPDELIENHGQDQLFIAHCLEEQKVALADAARSAAARPASPKFPAPLLRFQWH